MRKIQDITTHLEQIQPDILELFARTVAHERLGHAYLFEGARGTGKKTYQSGLPPLSFVSTLNKEIHV